MQIKDEMDKLITQALEKVKGSKEKEICKYLPAATGGYMHHFTMKKLKQANPEELRSLLQTFILNAATPREVEAKPRVRRNKNLLLNQSDLKLILKLARESGDRQLLTKLGAKLSLPQLKNELIQSIKKNLVEEELWGSYVQAIQTSYNLDHRSKTT